MYWFLKTLFKIASHIYFKNFKVNGKENLNTSGPVIYVANHPAAFLDPIIVATLAKRKIHFVAKATLFKNKLTSFFLKKLNMIPIHRKQDEGSDMSKNRDTFKYCVKHLRKGGNILIFPEGISIAERKIKEVKTGAARIALETIAGENSNLDLKIICIGINYLGNASFRSNLVIEISAPITVNEYLGTNNHQSVKNLTDDIRKQLEKNTISIENIENDLLIHRVEEIYTNNLLTTLELSKKNKYNHFFITKSFCNYLSYFQKNQPWRIHYLHKTMDNYYDELNKIDIEDKYIRRMQEKQKPFLKIIMSLFFIVIGFPVFIYGFIANFIPYQLTSLASRTMSKQKEFQVAISFAAGTFIYILYYSALAFLLQNYFSNYLLLTALISSVIFSGLFYLYFENFLKDEYNKIRVLRLVISNTGTMSKVFETRKVIIDELEKFRNDYVFNENLI